MGSGDAVGVGVGSGDAVGVGVGSGDAVGVGAAVGSGDAVGVGVGVGSGELVGSGDAVGVGVGSGDAVGVGAAVGSGVDDVESPEPQPIAKAMAAAITTNSRSQDCLLRRGFRGAMVTELAFIIGSIA
ncbi:MAG: hypothetical protein F4240_15700 [Acidimicrobiia bacterium]|nr:hypothetical protein [Acidimicrobiia bacterium]